MAFNTALSGLRAAQGDLGITGNNIANASTVGFKQSRAEFSDLYASSISGVSSRAIGNGTLLSNVGQQFSQGNISFTDNNLDLAINGNGFFMLAQGGAIEYSRSGIMGLDKDGFIVNNQGARLQGFAATEAGQIGGNLVDLQISSSNQSPQATSEVNTVLNLDSESTTVANNGILPIFDAADPTTYNHATSSTIYDSLGNSHVLSQYYVRDNTVNTRFSLTGTANTGTLDLTDSTGATLTIDFSTATADVNGDGVADAMGTSTDNDGAVLASYISNNVAGYAATYDDRNDELVIARQDGTSFTYTASAGAAATLLGSASGTGDTVDNRWHLYVQVDGNNVGGAPDPVTGESLNPSLLRREVIFNPDGSLASIGGATTTALNITNWGPGTGAVDASPFTLDIAGTTQFGSPFAVNGSSQDGFSTGRLVGVDIDDSGTVLARYSNGQSTVLGGVALANFNNPQGLTPTGDNAWTESFASGSPIIGNPGTSSLGLVQSGALEDSNVDLSDELVNLILAQRNYQANAKTIETADALTQTIINIR